MQLNGAMTVRLKVAHVFLELVSWYNVYIEKQLLFLELVILEH